MILDARLIAILEEAHTIAIVGCSPKPDRDSFVSARYFKDRNFEVVPINPNHPTILGMTAYPDLLSAGEAVGTIDIVNIYRTSEHVLPHVEEAVRVGPRLVWMQLGVVNEEAAEVARRAGIPVVMDECLRATYKRLHRLEKT